MRHALLAIFNYKNYPAFKTVFPLLDRTDMHSYSYDLKLLNSPGDARLASITLTPVLLNRGLSPDTMTDSDDLELEDARLIRFEPAH